MLSEEQLEIISAAIQPLFQYLENEVITDVAKRIQESLSYTRTAELQAISMRELGYGPARIRKEAMKLIKADEEYRKMVALNSLQHKRIVRKKLEEIRKEAYKANTDIMKKAGKLSYANDLSIWKDAGKALTDDSYLSQMIEAFDKQTKSELKNLTQTTGFKTMSGFESIEDLYRREMDKALIKICSGTFSREKVIRDTVHELSQSGLRSIDFASGYSMQLDTAVRLAIRTGAHQLSGKIMDKNIEQTGENLVYVSKHWGARNTGDGIANHEQWQGRVYYIKEGQDYREEAKRIGQDRIMNLWYATGYSVDGSHENNPLGLYGYNCRHNHYVWFLGVSTFPKEQPQPEPVTIDGKTYDYYAISQKMRSMERAVRALKREKEAIGKLGMDTKDIDIKIKRRVEEYKAFCENCNVREKTERMRYECGTSDLKKTKAWKGMQKLQYAESNNLGKEVYYDSTKDYCIELEGYNGTVIEGLNKAAREVAIEGSESRYEHMRLVNLGNGEIECPHTDGLPNQVGGKILYEYLKNHPETEYAFIHNHNTETELSLGDVELMVSNRQLPVVAAVRNDGIITVIESNGKHTSDFLPLRYDEQRTKYKEEKYGKKVPEDKACEYSLEIELYTRNLAIEEFSKRGIVKYE